MDRAIIYGAGGGGLRAPRALVSSVSPHLRPAWGFLDAEMETGRCFCVPDYENDKIVQCFVVVLWVVIGFLA